MKTYLIPATLLLLASSAASAAEQSREQSWEEASSVHVVAPDPWLVLPPNTYCYCAQLVIASPVAVNFLPVEGAATPVPEPPAQALLAMGAVVVGLATRRAATRR
jgi:hypothetical protein